MYANIAIYLALHHALFAPVCMYSQVPACMYSVVPACIYTTGIMIWSYDTISYYSPTIVIRYTIVTMVWSMVSYHI